MVNDMIKSDYYDKGTDFSVTDFTKNDYQLWVKYNFEKDNKPQGFKPWVGQLIHKASYDTPETNVIKEFSGVFKIGNQTIGGSIDRLVYDNGLWVVEDLKSQGMYPAKGAFKAVPDYWITQLSIYKYMMSTEYNFKVDTRGVIHQYVMGFQKNKDGMEEYNRLTLQLLTNDEVVTLLKRKVEVAMSEEAPAMDCQIKWQCDYCDYNNNCPYKNSSF